MSDSLTPTGVTGSDGVVPIYAPNDRWCWWSIGEIYNGTAGRSRFIPKVHDYVVDPETFTTYKVTALDPVTLIPTLVEIRPANMSFSFTETDVLFGVGPGTQSDTYRVYIDRSVVPYVLAVDARLKVAGSMTSFAKLFKGSQITDQGRVISKIYDSSGVFVSENVPLELVAIDSHVNHAIKSVSVCHTTEELADGEIVTAVFYSDHGHVVSKRQLLVENTSFIRQASSSMRYVSHISLHSAFLSPTLDKTIEFPLNIPINALNLMGRVHYTDGQTVDMPVDGNKFKIFGIDQYISSIIGQKISLVLSYTLSSDESAQVGVGTQGRYITEPYDLITINPNRSYSVKLYGYPFWIDDSVGYQMRWWLLNLDRNVFFDVTQHVNFDALTGPYDPKGYGYIQRKTVSLNLRQVSGAFKAFIHTQAVEIVLNGIPNTDRTPWTVSHESNVNRPMYGTDIYAKRITDSVVNLRSNINNYEEWKQRVYNATFPLINPSTEITPMSPTHFIVMNSGLTAEYSIDSWNTDISIPGAVALYNTLVIRFIKRTGSGDLELAVSALMVKP